jgi:hypothetical protein
MDREVSCIDPANDDKLKKQEKKEEGKKGRQRIN